MNPALAGFASKPSKQPCKKIGNEESICKNQGPNRDSPQTNLNSPSFFCFVNPEDLFARHFSIRRHFCKNKHEFVGSGGGIYSSLNRFFTIRNNNKPPKIIRQMIKRPEMRILRQSDLLPVFFSFYRSKKQILCQGISVLEDSLRVSRIDMGRIR